MRTWIEPDPYKPGASQAVVRGTGVPVWALVAYWHATGDLDAVARDYNLPREAVDAAMAYYREHKVNIDVWLEENAAEVTR